VIERSQFSTDASELSENLYLFASLRSIGTCLSSFQMLLAIWGKLGEVDSASIIFA